MMNKSMLDTCIRSLLAGLVMLALLTTTAHATEGGGGGEGGDSGNTAGSSLGGPPDIWNIDPEMTAGLETDPDGTVQLESPLEQNLREVWKGLGGQAGTGQSLDDWLSSARAGKSVKQSILEEDLDDAESEAASANRGYVMVKTVDQVGKGTQTMLSFVPGIKADIPLDVARAYVEAYNEAKAQGKSSTEAGRAALKHATIESGVQIFLNGTLGKASKKMLKTAQKIPFSKKMMKSNVKKVINTFGAGVTKGLEVGATEVAQEVREKNVDYSAPTHTPAPTTMTAPSFKTAFGHDVKI